MKGNQYQRTGLLKFLYCLGLASSVLVVSVRAEVGVPEILEKNVLLEADSISYDEEMREVSASGNVEISAGDSTLLAEHVIYKRALNLVSAAGNVVLMSPDGNVTFSDAMELTGDLKSGTIEAVQILFADGSRLAANGGRLGRDGRTEVRKAVYSPCPICSTSNLKNPLWQIKAISVVHDKSLKRIFYKDAVLEAFGIPVMYMPFFTHPDPSVTRKTGFLAPSLISNSLIGLTYKQPFFFNISPYQDATIAPIYTAKEGVVLTGEYRRALERGAFEVSGSATRSGKIVAVLPEIERGAEKTRGHLFAKGNYSVDSDWLAGVDISLASDRTYLGNYGFTKRYEPADIATRYRGPSHLTSQIFLERAVGRNYFNIEAIAFQSLNTSTNLDTVPYLLPVGTFSYRGDPSERGDYWLVDGSLRVLGRETGTESQRLVLKGGWRFPYTSRVGAKYSFNLGLRADGYHVSNFLDAQKPGGTLDGFEGRLLPEMYLDWRLPFVRPLGTSLLIVEPIGQLVWRPSYENTTKIPNEDSLAFEFDDLNLFSVDRFPGLDRYEGGARFNYGLRSEVNSIFLPDAEILVGQVLRAKVDKTYSDGTGLNQRLSDIVGRFTIAPSRFISLLHRFRLDRQSLATRSSSLQATGGTDWSRGSVQYMKVSDGPTDGLPVSLEQISVSLQQRLGQYWHGRLSLVRDLGDSGGTLSNGVGIRYQHDCITVDTFATRNYTKGSLVRPDTVLGIQVSLKNLGQSFGHQVNIVGGSQ
jgi:LPS-assembly protein